jgi:hypothetical protein
MGFRDTHASVFAEGYEGDAAADLLASFEADESLSLAALGEAQTENTSLSAQIEDMTASHEAEVNRLKAVNYDLFSQVPANNSDDPTISVENDGENIETFDDLFTELADTDTDD